MKKVLKKTARYLYHEFAHELVCKDVEKRTANFIRLAEHEQLKKPPLHLSQLYKNNELRLHA